MTYQHVNGRILLEIKLGTGNRLLFAAENVRRERTGIHATVGISMNGRALSWDNLNVERHRERITIANAAHRQLAELDKGVWPEDEHRQAFDLFCYGLWREHMKTMVGGPLEGDPEAVAPDRLCGPYVVDGAGSILYAPPGRGKSYTLMAMAASVDAGVDLIWPVRQRKCLFLNLERSALSMRYRLARVNAALGLDPRRPLTFINAKGRPLADLADSVRETMARHKCEVLMVDSISRTGMGGLSDDITANRVIDTLNSLSATWAASGHSPRSDDSHVFGSVHFTAGCDIEIRLLTQTQENVMGLGLQVTKANDLPPVPLFAFALEWDADGLTGVRRATTAEFPELAAGRQRTVTDEVEEYLGVAGLATASEIASEIGQPRTSVTSVLARSPRFVRVRKDGKDVLYGLKADASHD